jgi:small subunit ribosomal protein S16
MLVIRLLRAGKKNQPFFHIVVTEKQNPPKGGRVVERVGYYNPVTKEQKINSERVQYWLSKGAQPSATVHNFLVKAKLIQASKIAKNKKSKKEQKPEAPKTEAPKVEAPVVEAPKEEVKPEVK